jgi:hypothetical protein
MKLSVMFSEVQAGARDHRDIAAHTLMYARDAMLPGHWHPYGFIVYHLGADPCGRRLRLHVWPAGVRPKQQPEWPIHSHPWDFSSMILCGRVLHTRYVASRDSSGRYCHYSVSYAADASILVRTGLTLRVEPDAHETLLPGAVYQMKPPEYHQVYAADMGATATLVRTGAASVGSGAVLGSLDGLAVYRYVRTPVERNHSLEVLECTIKECSRTLACT